MLSILLLPGFVSAVLASAILSSSLDGYFDGYFETFAPDTTGSSDWFESIDAYRTAEDKGFKQHKLNPTQDDPCPNLRCLCSKKYQHFTVVQIDEADPYDAAADLDRQLCKTYQIYCCSVYDPHKRKGFVCYNAFD